MKGAVQSWGYWGYPGCVDSVNPGCYWCGKLSRHCVLVAVKMWLTDPDSGRYWDYWPRWDAPGLLWVSGATGATRVDGDSRTCLGYLVNMGGRKAVALEGPRTFGLLGQL
jgi:hypothetical protein